MTWANRVFYSLADFFLNWKLIIITDTLRFSLQRLSISRSLGLCALYCIQKKNNHVWCHLLFYRLIWVHFEHYIFGISFSLGLCEFHADNAHKRYICYVIWMAFAYQSVCIVCFKKSSLDSRTLFYVFFCQLSFSSFVFATSFGSLSLVWCCFNIELMQTDFDASTRR